MKYHLIYSVVVCGILISGCETYPSRKVTLVIDTQPSGAEIHRKVPGGAWMRCQGHTPAKLSLELGNVYDSRLYEDVVGLKKANGRSVNSKRQADLPFGLNYRYSGSSSRIDFRNTEFRKTGYLPLRPSEEVNCERIWRHPHNKYNFIFPLIKEDFTIESPSPPHLQTASTITRPSDGFLFNLRAVSIPSGNIVSATSGVAGSKKDTPDILAKLCDDLEAGWKGQQKSRISIIGIVGIDAKTKESQMGKFATECLYTAMGRLKSLTLTEGSQIKEFLKEHNLTIEEVLDNPKSLEKMAGIDYVILGSVFWTGN